MRIGSLFSGVGGLELGLEMSGIGHTVWQVEQDPFCREVLAKQWPDATRHRYVQHVGKTNLEPVSLVAGGFPCQDISSAGSHKGLDGDSSGLWFEFARIVGELSPEWVVVENVSSGADRWIDPVREHLARLGYASIPVPLSAEDVGAPHERDRVFIVAQSIRTTSYTDGETQPTQSGYGKVACIQEIAGPSGRLGRPPVSEVHGMDDGFSRWMDGAPVSPTVDVPDGRRLKALGNAVVPQCAEVIGWMIREMQKEAELCRSAASAPPK